MALNDLFQIAILEKEVERLKRELDRLTWREHGTHRVCRHCNAFYPMHRPSCITQSKEQK